MYNQTLKTCNKCLVRYSADKTRCPICHNDKTSQFKYHIDLVPKKQKTPTLKLFIISFTALVLLTPGFIMLLLDWQYDHSLEWAMFSIVPLFFGWIYFSLILLFYHKPIILGLLLLITSIILLFALNFLHHGTWFVSFGLPLSISIFITSTITFLVMKNIKNKITSCIVFLVGILTTLIIIEFLFNLYIYDKIQIQWSLIVLSGVLPIILGLLWLKRKKSLLHRWIHF